MTKDQFFKRFDIDIRNGRLGGGAFGTVYKAYDHVMGVEKAVKVAEVKYLNGKEFSLQAEYDATKDLPVHMNIANYDAVYQFQMPNGLFDYAIMQYYPDGNLKELLQNKALSQDVKCEIIDGIFEGIGFLHEYNILHRDIKPSNILISEREGKYTPKIADFGLSKLVSSNDLEAITNSFGGGTLEYSSPEQLLGNDLRFNADLWSAGVIAYEMLRGKIPFISNDVTGSADARRRIIFQNIVNAPIPPDIVKCPSPYDRVIKACLIKSNAERIQSYSDLLILKENEDFEIEIVGEADDETLIMTPEQRKELLGEALDEVETIDPAENREEETRRKKPLWYYAMFFVLGMLLLFGAKYLYTLNASGPVNEASSTTISEADLENEILDEETKDLDAQTLIRVKQEDKIWEFTLKDGTLEAYEEYKTLYPKGRYLRDVDSLITLKLEEVRSNNEKEAIAYAEKTQSISAYRDILNTFPDSPNRDKIENKIIQLEAEKEAEFWATVQSENTIEAYQDFVAIYPNSERVDTANDKIEELFKLRLQRRAYKKALKMNTVSGYDKFLKENPKSIYTQEIQAKRQSLLKPKRSPEITSPSNDKSIKTISNDVSIQFTENEQKPVPEKPEIEDEVKNLDGGDDNSVADVNEQEEDNQSGAIAEEPKLEDNEDSNEKIEEVELSPLVLALEGRMAILSPVEHQLGCDSGCDSDAMPSKKVGIRPIKISKYEVTQAEWKEIMGGNPSYFDDCLSCPVESVSYAMVQEYISKLNASPGNPYTYRLPTEAEWEYAAGAGTKFKFAGSNSAADVAVYKSTSKNGTAKVGSRKSNRFILYDMSGNVSEWCSSWYNENGFTDPAKKEFRVVRGGNWRSKTSSCQVKKRDKAHPKDKKSTIGFRLVRSI